jgi:CheY-like chemotaxis protein
MGGRMGFESRAGQGTCFFFELPLWTEPSSQAAPLVPSAASQPAHGARILVVEDDIDVARVLGQMLERAGYVVDAAASGAQALERARQTRYAAITLDLLLPDIGGQQLIGQLRGEAATAGVPIIVISARMEEGRQALGNTLPGVEWLANRWTDPSARRWSAWPRPRVPPRGCCT